MKLAKLFFGVLAFVPVMAVASVTADCGGSSDVCFASVSSPGSPTPFHYDWGLVNTQPGATVYRKNCGDRATCTFFCPFVSEVSITWSVTVTDANNQLIGSASATGTCTPQPVIGGN